MFATLFLGVVLAVFLTLGVVRGDAERGLLAAADRPADRARRRCCSPAGSARSPSARRTSLAVYVAAMVITGLTGHWWPDHIVVPGDRARRRRRDRRRALAARLGLPHLDRERDRDLHGLRRRASSPACSARSATRSTRTRSRTRRRSPPGRCRSRRSTRTRCAQITANTTGLTGFLLQLGPFGGANTGGPAVRLWALRLPRARRGGRRVRASRARTSDSPRLLAQAARERDPLLLRLRAQPRVLLHRQPPQLPLQGAVALQPLARQPAVVDRGLDRARRAPAGGRSR